MIDGEIFFILWMILLIACSLICMGLGAWFGFLKGLNWSPKAKMLRKIIDTYKKLDETPVSNRSKLYQLFGLMEDAEQVLIGIDPFNLDYEPDQVYDDLFEGWHNWDEPEMFFYQNVPTSDFVLTDMVPVLKAGPTSGKRINHEDTQNHH